MQASETLRIATTDRHQNIKSTDMDSVKQDVLPIDAVHRRLFDFEMSVVPSKSIGITGAKSGQLLRTIQVSERDWLPSQVG